MPLSVTGLSATDAGRVVLESVPPGDHRVRVECGAKKATAYMTKLAFRRRGGRKVGHSVRYEVNANWKLIFQNYSECYHCGPVHPPLAKITPPTSGENDLTDGPFAETKELVAGFWLWNVSSMQEAIDWVKRAPNPFPGTESEIEIRQVFAAEDFGEALTPELREQEERLRSQAAKK